MRMTRWVLVGLIGLLVAGCALQGTPVTPRTPTATSAPAHTATATPTAEPTLRQAQGTALTPTVSPTLTPAVTLATIREGRVITVEAEELAFNYSQELYWDEGQFAREYDAYSADKARYLEDIVEGFSEKFLESSNLQATGWRISFTSEYELEADKATYFTLIQCKVHGAASGTAESPYFRSEWLLKPLLEKGTDLYDFEYTPDKTALVYEGESDHTPITIIFRFPKPVGHCHYHIWYER